MLPIFLWSGTLIAPYATEAAKAVHAFPTGLPETALITHSTLEGPVEKFVAYFIGLANGEGGKYILIAIMVLIAYLLLFMWYRKQMIKRNEELKLKRDSI